MSIGKRPYTLSEAALAQRRRVSPFAKKKRATEPPMPEVYVSDFADLFAPLPKDAPHSEHQRRAALIRGRQIRNGTLNGSVGGRRKISRACAQCGEFCDSAREARDHCRVARKIIAE